MDDEKLKSAKCTQCGRCCKAQVCRIGFGFTGATTPPCPALITSDMVPSLNDKTVCGIRQMIKKEHLPVFDSRLGIGTFCDSIFNPHYKEDTP
jgi:Fe-S oxidoreductase